MPELISVVVNLLERANARRRLSRSRAARGEVGDGAEERLEALFACSERLAVYGSLAPGRANHHVVAPLGGAWTDGVVEGDLTRFGWGVAIGYPALRLRPGGPPVLVRVLASPALPAAWDDLDAFEGAEYRRVLVPVWSSEDPAGRSLVSVANVYEAALEDP